MSRQNELPLLTRLVEEIAKHKGIEPNDPNFCLYEETDPRALDLLFQNTSGPLSTQFQIEETSVSVEKTAEGTINVEVSPTSKSPPAAD